MSSILIQGWTIHKSGILFFLVYIFFILIKYISTKFILKNLKIKNIYIFYFFSGLILSLSFYFLLSLLLDVGEETRIIREDFRYHFLFISLFYLFIFTYKYRFLIIYDTCLILYFFSFFLL